MTERRGSLATFCLLEGYQHRPRPYKLDSFEERRRRLTISSPLLDEAVTITEAENNISYEQAWNAALDKLTLAEKEYLYAYLVLNGHMECDSLDYSYWQMIYQSLSPAESEKVIDRVIELLSKEFRTIFRPD